MEKPVLPRETVNDTHLAPDPLTGEPGAHPVESGTGTAAGAAVGAIDPTVEEAYWRANFAREPYYSDDKDFADYGPAYQMGVARYSRDSIFDDHEPAMAEDWETSKGISRLH